MKSYWVKVKNLKVGQKIAVPTDNGGVLWDKIASIKHVGRELVWDIEVKGTHNFVAGHLINPETGEKYTEKEEKQLLREEQIVTSSRRDRLQPLATSAAGRYGGIFAHNTYTQGLSVNRNGQTAPGDVDISGSYLTNGADYAEYFYAKDKDLKPGETVCLDVAGEGAVKRCVNSRDDNLLGIVSSHPSVLGNTGTEQDQRGQNPDYVVVGLLGQIPAKVSLENGDIRPGDSLTSSSVPGHLARASAGDPTVGVALEAFGDVGHASTEGNVGSGDNGAMEQGEGDVQSIAGNVGSGTIQVLISRKNKSLTVESVEEEVIERIANLELEDEVEIIVAQAQKNLETQIADQILTIEANKAGLTDLAGKQSEIKGQITDLNLGFKNLSGSQDKIQSSVSSLAEQVDVLVSSNSQLESEVETLHQKVADSQKTTDVNLSQLTNNLQDLINSLSGLSDVSSKIELMSQSVLSVMDSNQALSGRLDEVEVMKTELGELITFTPDVVVITSPEIIASEDEDAVKNYKTLVLDARSGLEIKSGNFKLDASGNVEISGNLLLGGELSAAKISPTGNNLVLEPKGEEPKVVVKGNLEVQGKVLTAERKRVNEDGDEAIVDKTTGTSLITAGETIVHISNNQISDSSLIYITPTSKTGGKVLFVASKRSEAVKADDADYNADEPLANQQGFSVEIEEVFENDIEFNWWIVE